jgi:hypothetical protein
VTLDFYDVQRLMNDFTYKPNTGFRVSESYGPIVATIRVLAYCPDSTDMRHAPVEPHWKQEIPEIGHFFVSERYWTQNLRLTEITAAWSVPRGLDEKDFKPWLRKQIRRFEDHEMDEFFKFGGQCVYNPHHVNYEQQIKEIERHGDYLEQRQKAGVLHDG